MTDTVITREVKSTFTPWCAVHLLKISPDVVASIDMQPVPNSVWAGDVAIFPRTGAYGIMRVAGGYVTLDRSKDASIAHALSDASELRLAEDGLGGIVYKLLKTDNAVANHYLCTRIANHGKL